MKSAGSGTASDATIEHPAHVPNIYIWDPELGEEGGWVEPAGNDKEALAKAKARVAKAEDALKQAKAALAALQKEG